MTVFHTTLMIIFAVAIIGVIVAWYLNKMD